MDRLDELEIEQHKLEEEIRKIFMSKIRSHHTPNALPRRWGVRKLSLSLPFDMMTPKNIGEILTAIVTPLERLKKLRDEEGRILLQREITKTRETVPE